MSHLYAEEKMYCENCEEDVLVQQFLSDDLPACPECGCEELMDCNLRDNAAWLLDKLEKARDIIGSVPHSVFGDADEVAKVVDFWKDSDPAWLKSKRS